MTATKKHSRWAAWEQGVLGKVDPELASLKVTERRRREVDDDANESDVVREMFQKQLRCHGRNPDKCCEFLRVELLAEWLEKATGERRSRLKITPYLRTLGISELSEKRRSDSRGWVWRGKQAGQNQEPKVLSAQPDFED